MLPIILLSVAGVAGAALAEAAVPPLASDCRIELAQHRLQTWNSSDGLILDSVLALARDEDGQLWIGTEDGLSRFDGMRFESADLTAALQGQPAYIEALALDVHGRLHVATSGSGVVVLDAGRLAGARRTAIRDGWIEALLADPGGGMWAGGRGTGLQHVDGDRVSRWGVSEGLSSDHVTALAPRRAGGLWLGYATGGVQWFHHGHVGTVTLPERLRASWIEGLHEDARGRLWTATRDGLYRVQRGQAHRFGTAEGLPDRFVEAVVGGLDDRIWVATGTGGLARRCDGEFQVLDRRHGLPVDRIEALLPDGQGGMWIGTGGGGLARASVGAAIPITARQGLPDRPVLPLLAATDGALWAGTYGAGVVRLQGDQPTIVAPGEDSPSRSIFALAEAPDGTIWAGTRDGLFHLEDGRVRRHVTTADGLPHPTVASLLHDGTRLWIGLVGALASLEPDGRTSTYPIAGAPLRSNVVSLLRDTAGGLWAGTDGDGLFRLEQDRLEPVTGLEALPSRSVLSLYQDRPGVLWLGTSAGLVRWDGDLTQHLSAGHGLQEGNVFAIRRDGFGDMWISGNRGVYRIDGNSLEAVAAGRAQRLEVRRFDRSDGMPSSETNGGFQPAVAQGAGGRLWFPTTAGIARFDPAAIRAGSRPPAPRLRAVVTSGRRFAADRALSLPARPGAVELMYSAVALSEPEDVQFQYRLRPVDDRWYTTTESRVVYGQLPAGDLQFDLRARLPGEAWSAPVTARLSVARHPAEHPAIRAAAAVLALALGWLLLRLRRRHLALRAQRAQDTQKLEALGQLAGGIAHDFNNILTAIIGMAESVSERLAPHSPLRRDVDMILDAGERGAELTRQLLSFARRGSSTEREIDLAEDVRSMEVFLRRVMPSNIELRALVEGDPGRCRMNPSQLQQIVLNLALNARDAMPDGGTLEIELAPVTDETELREVALKPSRRYARLVVADSGSGMDRKTRERLFEPFFTTKAPGKGTGLGLAIVAGIVREQGGGIAVDSDPDAGTRFRVYLRVES